MVKLRTLRALGAIDTGSILADPMLRGLAIVPLMAALAIRLILPSVAARIGVLAGVDMSWIVAPLAGYAVVGIAPLIAGSVIGFLLLDQRDDRTLLALQVTPLPLGVYLAYRLAAPMLAAFVVTLAAVAVAAPQGLGPWEALLAAVAAIPLAPLSALALSAFARNKVQGAALMKMSSLVLMAPLAGLFLPPDWGLTLALLPTSWVAWATWSLQAGTNAWGALVGAWVLNALLCGALLLRLRVTLTSGG